MILERLVLENFRQFKGRQEIVFAEPGEGQNVTVIHAGNGFGKTTLLNAIRWVLHGHEALTKDFEKPERILHEGVAAKAKNPEMAEASVELTFHHEGDRYVATRSLSLQQQRANANKSKLSLTIVRDGQSFSEPSPQEKLRKIIPTGIRDFLFFNGENIDHFAMQEKADAVKDAIRQMLGLKLLDNTIEDLLGPKVRKVFEDALKEETSDEKAELIERQEELETRLGKLQSDLKQIIANIEASTAAIRDVENQLAANQEAAELQARRTKIQKEKDELVDRKTEIERKLSRLIAEDGYTLFANDLVQRGQEIMAELRSEGKVPAKVLKEYLQELLDRRVCICQRDLADETPHRAAVGAKWASGKDQAFNNNVSKLDHAIGLIDGVAQKTTNFLEDLNRQRLETSTRIHEIDGELNEIHGKIGKKDSNSVKELEGKRTEHSLRRDAEIAAKGGKEKEIESSEAEIQTIEDRIEQIAETEEQAIIARERVKAVKDCADLLKKIRDAETNDLRPRLSELISDHCAKIINRKYTAELRPDFSLGVTKNVSKWDGTDEEMDVAKNTALRQSLSLVFISSLVHLASERKKIPTIMKNVSGEDYPVVMDSPFGALDDHYCSRVAKWIPALAKQVVILVSSKQYAGPVQKALEEEDRVGRNYFLSYSGPTLPNDMDMYSVINGRKYKIYETSKEEITKIQEVKE